MSPAIGCGVGTLLLQPQRVQRATTADPDEALVDDFLDLAVRLIGDASHGGTLLHVMEEAVQAAAQGLLHTLADRLDSARNHLQTLLSPLVHRVQAIGDLFAKTSTPLEALQEGLGQFEALATALEGLSIDRLRQVTTAFVTVMETDLGLSSATIEGMAWGLITDIIDRIDHAPPETTAFLRQNRHQLVSVLRRLERRFRGTALFPPLDAEAIARDAFDHLTRSGLAPALSKVSCEAHNLATAATSVESVLGAVPFSGFGSRSVGAAAAKPASHGYLWYPSWLLASKQSILPWNSADIWKGDDGKIYRRDQVLFDSTTFDWTAIPSGDPSKPPLRYTFGVSPEAMEYLAWITAFVADAAEMVMHLIHARPGHNVGDYIHGSLLAADGFLEGFGRMPWLFWIRHGAGVGPNFGAWVLAQAPVLATVLGGSFQGFHTKAAAGKAVKLWIILLAFDAMNAYSTATTCATARDFFLDCFTLGNYQGPPLAPASPATDNRPDNRKEVDGFVAVTSLVMGWLSTQLFPREEYSIYGFKTAKLLLVRWLVIGVAVFGSLGSLTGVLAAEGIARSLDAGVFLEKWSWGLLKATIAWPFLLYGFRENNTDGGKYNPLGDPFDGYPKPRSSSPYKLPYEKGKAICCVQGNQGLFSHHHLPGLSQVYAYDLALDQEDEVLVAREGVVVDWFDWVPDNTSDATNGDPALSSPGQTASKQVNFILVRHDTPVADHDKDARGAQATTYAAYLHGRLGSVRQVFQARGVAPGSIIGTAVHQGQPIMLAGSTGMSFHNHVHMEVRSGPPSATPVVAVQWGSLNQWTIPFVFDEDSAGDDGILESKTFYESSNVRVP